MRKICTGILAAALALGLLATAPAQAKVYKMTQEERAAALKDKKQKRAKAKKAGKAAPGQDQGGWVEVKPGEKPARKSKKASVEELAKAAEKKGKKAKKGKQAAPDKADKPAKAAGKVEVKASAQPADSIVVEKKGKKAKADKLDKAERADKADKADKAEKAGKKSSRRAGNKGDRVVGSNYTGERKVSASSTEVRRTGDELNSISVSRPAPAHPTPGHAAPAADKPAAQPEVRQEVQSGPMDASKPVGTEQKAGEGRF